MTNKKVTPSTGNVFADLELENADELLVKAELALRITQVIKGHGLTQIAAARKLGIDQPKVSRLVRGELYGFSTTNSWSFSTRLGMTSRSLSANGPGGAKRVASLSCRPHDGLRCNSPVAAGDRAETRYCAVGPSRILDEHVRRSGRVSSASQGDRAASYTYTASGDLASATDSIGRTTTYTQRGRPARIRNHARWPNRRIFIRRRWQRHERGASVPASAHVCIQLAWHGDFYDRP